MPTISTKQLKAVFLFIFVRKMNFWTLRKRSALQKRVGKGCATFIRSGVSDWPDLSYARSSCVRTHDVRCATECVKYFVRIRHNGFLLQGFKCLKGKMDWKQTEIKDIYWKVDWRIRFAGEFILFYGVSF